MGIPDIDVETRCGFVARHRSWWIAGVIWITAACAHAQAAAAQRAKGSPHQVAVRALAFEWIRQGAGQGDAKDFFNNLVMTRIKGSSSDPAAWLKQLAQWGAESDAASTKLASEING